MDAPEVYSKLTINQPGQAQAPSSGLGQSGASSALAVVQNLLSQQATGSSNEKLLLEILQHSGGSVTARTAAHPKDGVGVFLRGLFFATEKASIFPSGTTVNVLTSGLKDFILTEASPSKAPHLSGNTSASTKAGSQLERIAEKAQQNSALTQRLFSALSTSSATTNQTSAPAPLTQVLSNFSSQSLNVESNPTASNESYVSSFVKGVLRPLFEAARSDQIPQQIDSSKSGEPKGSARQQLDTLARALRQVELKSQSSANPALTKTVEALHSKIQSLELALAQTTKQSVTNTENTAARSAAAPIMLELPKTDQANKLAEVLEQLGSAMRSEQRPGQNRATAERFGETLGIISEAVRNLNSRDTSEAENQLLILPALVTGLPSDIYLKVQTERKKPKGRAGKNPPGTKSLELNLTLPSLGPVAVKIKSHYRNASILFVTRSEKVSGWLEENFSVLKEQIERRGFNTPVLRTIVKKDLKHTIPSKTVCENGAHRVIA